MKLSEMNLDQYLALVSSDAPAPGGGSASALCGAQGAGLLSMVARLTLSKKKYEDHHKICTQVVEKTDEIAKRLTAQIDSDAEAYGGLSAAFRLPKDTEEEKISRKAAIQKATRHATEVPFETMRLGAEALTCAQELVGHYNTNCASDVGCAVNELMACIKGAYFNVLINVGTSALADEFLPECKKILNDANCMAAELMESVEADMIG